MAEFNNIRNCKRCGRVFVSSGLAICPQCLQQEDIMYEKVREYLKKHPGQSAVEISAATEVPVAMVTEFISRGMLERTLSKGEPLVCMICKKPISFGKICPTCEALLGNVVRSKNRKDDTMATDNQVERRMYSMDLISRKKR